MSARIAGLLGHHRQHPLAHLVRRRAGRRSATAAGAPGRLEGVAAGATRRCRLAGDDGLVERAATGSLGATGRGRQWLALDDPELVLHDFELRVGRTGDLGQPVLPPSGVGDPVLVAQLVG